MLQQPVFREGKSAHLFCFLLVARTRKVATRLHLQQVSTFKRRGVGNAQMDIANSRGDLIHLGCFTGEHRFDHV